MFFQIMLKALLTLGQIAVLVDCDTLLLNPLYVFSSMIGCIPFSARACLLRKSREVCGLVLWVLSCNPGVELCNDYIAVVTMFFTLIHLSDAAPSISHSRFSDESHSRRAEPALSASGFPSLLVGTHNCMSRHILFKSFILN